MSETFKANHILKKDFICEEGREIYKKGCPVFIPKLHRKHYGFCCNVFFLTKRGRIKYAASKFSGGVFGGGRALAIFSKDLFKSKKDWFVSIEGLI